MDSHELQELVYELKCELGLQWSRRASQLVVGFW